MFNNQYSIFSKKSRRGYILLYRACRQAGSLFLIPYFLLLTACNSTYTSKKTGYYKIDFPERKYVQFNKEGFPYTFEYPAYATIIQDSSYFDNKPENDYWINVDFPGFNGRIFLSYKIVGGKVTYPVKQADGNYKDSVALNVFDKMVDDAFKLTHKNESVSGSIKNTLIHTPNGLTGILFKVGGNAATAEQFFLSDTTKNFIRGALYFAATPNVDSIKPVQDFIEKDIEHLINTFQWVNKTEMAKPK